MRGLLILVLVVILGAAGGAAAAREATPGLYDRPVLALDPGMHTAQISRADVDAAGRLAVTGSLDRTVRVWRLADGALLRTIRLPTGPGNVGKVYAVAISPDGTTIAAGGWTRTMTSPAESEQVYLFDAETGKMVGRLDGLPNVVYHLAFSPDGRRLAAVLGDGHGLRLYRRTTDGRWAEQRRDPDYGGSSYGVAFAPDGRLATTSDDGRLRLYDADGGLIRAVDSGFAQPFGLAFNPVDGRLAVGFVDTTAVRLFDGATLAALPPPDGTGIDNWDLSKIAWSADGATLFAAGRHQDGGVHPVLAWDTTGARTRLPGGDSTVMSLTALPDGGLLVAAADLVLGVLDAEGQPRWTHRPVQMDARDQHRALAVSADGLVVDFGFEVWGKRPARFDVAALALTQNPPEDGRTAPPRQDGLAVKNWISIKPPTLNGTPLPLDRYERSRSLAIHPDGDRFVLGTEWSLRAFDDTGTELWRRAAPGIVWAVNIAANGDLVVAAYHDGTLRWHRMDNGTELLALFPFDNGEDWIAWEPEGRYAGTLRATRALRWVVNRGWDATPETFRAGEIRQSFRPEVIRRVLPLLGTTPAIHAAENAARTEDFRRLTGGLVPGARLHVLAIGVGDYAADHLTLQYADDDATDVATTLSEQMDWPYQPGFQLTLRQEEATARSILFAFSRLRETLARSPQGQDLAVVLFSGHGVVQDIGEEKEFYLLPHDVDVTRPEDLRRTAISGYVLRQQIKALAAHGRVLVLIDACNAGAALSGGGPLGIAGRHLRALATGNVTVLASSRAIEVSREDDAWRNGAFTEAVLEALTHANDHDGNGFISVGELTEYVTRRLPVMTGGRQTPTIETRFTGDLFAIGS